MLFSLYGRFNQAYNAIISSNKGPVYRVYQHKLFKKITEREIFLQYHVYKRCCIKVCFHCLSFSTPPPSPRRYKCLHPSFLYRPTAIHDCHYFTSNWHLTFRSVSEVNKLKVQRIFFCCIQATVNLNKC